MNKTKAVVINIIEGVLILAAVAAGAYYFTGPHLLESQSFPAFIPENHSSAQGKEAPASEGIAAETLPAGHLAPVSSLRRMFFYEPNETAVIEAQAPQPAEEITIPELSYAGMVKLDDDYATYLFTAPNLSRPLSIKAGDTVDGLRLLSVKKTTSGTLFTFLYKGEKFSVSDRN